MVGWVVYWLAVQGGVSVVAACFTARWRWRCSAVCWLWCAAALLTVFPPAAFSAGAGAGIYYTVYAFITGDNAGALFKGVETLK